MIEDLLRLRNEVNKDRFRFDMTFGLWAAHYVSDEEMGANNFVKVVENGILRGYAVFTLLTHGKIKAYRILEICAGSREVLTQLIDQIIQYGSEQGIDFIYVRKDEGPLDTVFDEKKFVSFVDCVIMPTLLNPHELLLSMSEETDTDQGKVLKLVIKGFDPIFLRVKRGKITVVEQDRFNVIVRLDSNTFLRLFFGKTSFFKEFLKRRITIENVFDLSTVAHFFNAIKQEKWYIPLGDWT